MNNDLHAGTHMDSLIVTRLWGNIVVHDGATGDIHLVGTDRKKVSVPKFSTDVEDAQRVIQYMTSIGYSLGSTKSRKSTLHRVRFEKLGEKDRNYVRSDSLAMAICLAALEVIDELKSMTRSNSSS